MKDRAKAINVLAACTGAFAVCFAVWTMYGVLVTFLVDEKLFDFSRSQMGWLIGVPILSGALLRLPAGMLADRFGGRPVFTAIMVVAAFASYLTSHANGFWAFVAGGLGFGLAGASFAVGVAYTAVWFPPQQQGTALGVFGFGNVGAALTALTAPALLGWLTLDGAALDRWRLLPQLYALILLGTAVVFWLVTHPRRVEGAAQRTLRQRMEPLRHVRVWRFGLYYFVLFGGFVALAQWLIPYYVNVYTLSVVAAGFLSSAFSLPSALSRTLGGWLSDRFGARSVMYGVLAGCIVVFLLLSVPRMDIQSPGEGVTAAAAGTVTAVTEDLVQVDDMRYPLRRRPSGTPYSEETIIFPTTASWQDPVVRPGDVVPKRALLARGTTHIYFQANIRVFTGLLFIAGLLMGIGMAAVFKHIPTYFPQDVGTVGGVVGVVGGLGGFVGPILFGYLLDATGIWTMCWVFLAVFSVVCLAWMHTVIRRMLDVRAPDAVTHFDEPGAPIPLAITVRCPVHEIDARVRVMVSADNDVARLTACSLHPDTTGHVPCEGRCVVLSRDRAEGAVR